MTLSETDEIVIAALDIPTDQWGWTLLTDRVGCVISFVLTVFDYLDLSRLNKATITRINVDAGGTIIRGEIVGD